MQGYLRPKIAAEYCCISERTLREWLKEGLRHIKHRGIVLIKVEWIDEFLSKYSVDSDAAVDKIVSVVMKEMVAKDK